MGKAVNELLEGSLRVSCNGGVISEEHLPGEDFAHLCLGSEACQVEQATVASGVQVDALFGFAEGVTQQQGAQDANYSPEVETNYSPEVETEKPFKRKRKENDLGGKILCVL